MAVKPDLFGTTYMWSAGYYWEQNTIQEIPW